MTPRPINSDADSTSETWAALLAHWTAVAQAASALPADDDHAARWRASVAPMIALQAIVFALADLARLDPTQRAVGVDRSGVLVPDHARALSEAWRGQAMPRSLFELLGDARAALDAAAHLGQAFVVRGGADRFVMPDLGRAIALRARAGSIDAVRFALAADVGTELGPGVPAAFFSPVAPQLESAVTAPAQVYETRDGGVRRLEVAPYLGELRAGRPLLRVVVADGRLLV